MFSRSNKLVLYVVGLATMDRQLVASSTGTGTIINNEGIVLTASHVLQSASGESLVGISLIGRPSVCKSFTMGSSDLFCRNTSETRKSCHLGCNLVNGDDGHPQGFLPRELHPSELTFRPERLPPLVLDQALKVQARQGTSG